MNVRGTLKNRRNWRTATKQQKEQVSVQPSTAAVNVTLLASAADRLAAVRQPCSNRYLPSDGPTAANPPHAAGQTDGHHTMGVRT